MGFFGLFKRKTTNAQDKIAARPNSPRSTLFTTTLDKHDIKMMREQDETRRYRGLIDDTARRAGMPQSVICGIGSRASRWGLDLKPPGPAGSSDFGKRLPNDHRSGMTPPDGAGFKRGLLQFDYDWHEFARVGNWQDPRASLRYIVEVLNKHEQFLRQNGVPKELILHATIASFDAGVTPVLEAFKAGKDVDCKTSKRNYSADVLNRAGWYQLQGWR